MSSSAIRRLLHVTVGVLALGIGAFSPATAQFVQHRSQSYMLVTDGSDAMAQWTNPAGLAVFSEASIFADLVVDRFTGTTRVSQYSAGFNSRGISVGYQRNRFEGASSTSVLRFSYAGSFGRGSFGIGASWYGVEGSNPRDLDFGILYQLLPTIDVGSVLRHVGRAEVDSIKQPLVLESAVKWTAMSGFLQISAGSLIFEDLVSGPDTEYEIAYRAAIRLSFGGGMPITAFATTNLGSNFRIDELHLGFAVGGRSYFSGVGTGVSRNGDVAVEQANLTALRSNVFGPGR